MNHRIKDTNPETLVRRSAIYADVLDTVWMYRELLAVAIKYALTHASTEHSPDCAAAKQFLTCILRRIRSPIELIMLCELLNDNEKDDLLGFAAHNYGLNPRVIVVLFDDMVLLSRLKPPSIWCTDALWVRATWLFEEYPDRRFSIEELIPKYVSVEVQSKSILGAALDNQRLTEESAEQARRMRNWHSK